MKSISERGIVISKISQGNTFFFLREIPPQPALKHMQTQVTLPSDKSIQTSSQCSVLLHLLANTVSSGTLASSISQAPPESITILVQFSVDSILVILRQTHHES